MEMQFSRLAAADHFRGLSPREFAAAAADFMGEVNAIHPFREGNGRTLNLFMALVSVGAGYELDLRKIKREPYMRAMIHSFDGQTSDLAELVRLWISAET